MHQSGLSSRKMQQVSLLAFNPNRRRVRVREGTCGGHVGGGGQGRGREGPNERGKVLKEEKERI